MHCFLIHLSSWYYLSIHLLAAAEQVINMIHFGFNVLISKASHSLPQDLFYIRKICCVGVWSNIKLLPRPCNTAQRRRMKSTSIQTTPSTTKLLAFYLWSCSRSPAFKSMCYPCGTWYLTYTWYTILSYYVRYWDAVLLCRNSYH